MSEVVKTTILQTIDLTEKRLPISLNRLAQSLIQGGKGQTDGVSSVGIKRGGCEGFENAE